MDDITIRRCMPEDLQALERLAGVDSARRPAGETLLAVVAGEPVAAIEVATLHTVADPFEYTAAAVALLRARAVQVRSIHVGPRRTRAWARATWRRSRPVVSRP